LLRDFLLLDADFSTFALHFLCDFPRLSVFIVLKPIPNFAMIKLVSERKGNIINSGADAKRIFS